MKKVLTFSLLALSGLSMYAKDIKEFVVTTTPQMQCQNCEDKIKKNLRFEKGVTNIQTDRKGQCVIVTYDADKTNEQQLTNAFKKINYQVKKTSKPTKAVAIGVSEKKSDATTGASAQVNRTKANSKSKKAPTKKVDANSKTVCPEQTEAPKAIK